MEIVLIIYDAVNISFCGYDQAIYITSDLIQESKM